MTVGMPDTASSPPLTEAVEYWEMIGRTTRWGRYLAERERSAILRGERVAKQPAAGVDVGCGGGRWSKILSDLGWEMTCIDIRTDALHACQQKIPSARCVLATSQDRAIPCATNSQRLLLCMEVPYVLETDWFADEAYRI